MAVYKRGKVWWYEFRFLGVRVRETSHSRSKEVAIRAERKRRQDMELAVNGLQPQRRLISFEEAVEEWKDQKRAGWSESYANIQKYNLEHLLTTDLQLSPRQRKVVLRHKHRGLMIQLLPLKLQL